MDSVKIAAAQISPVFLDKEKTINKACETIKEAAENGAKLVVFPEAFIPGYPDWTWLVPNSKGAELNNLYEILLKNSVSIPKDTKKLCAAAKEAGIYVVVSVNEKNSEASNSSLYNTIIYIDDKGNILGKHRKLIPTGGERLIWAQGDGSTLDTYTTPFGKLGGLICWENFMPLARTDLYAQGVNILAAPTWDKSSNWKISMQHIAREGGMFIISCCMVLKIKDIPDKFEFKKLYPKDREWVTTGNSVVVSPDGKIIAGPLEGEGILYADLDLKLIAKAKRMFDVAGHYGRPDVFKFKVDRTEHKHSSRNG